MSPVSHRKFHLSIAQTYTYSYLSHPHTIIVYACHCRDHVPGPHVGGPFEKLPCNAWVYCPDELCFEADIHTHTKGDCWLKFTEAPQLAEINARGNFSMEFRARHPTAPLRTQWISGVLLPPGQILTNGTWGPRASW